jgi:hypothetical protein
VPCTCGIGPVKIGPYDGDELTRVPWVPDCTKCSDTGWTFSHYITAGLVSPDLTYPCPSQARSAHTW